MATAPQSSRVVRRVVLGAAALALGASSLTGCQQIAEAFNSIQGGPPGAASTATPVPQPVSTTATMDFDSLFSYDGSVSLTTDVASDLEVVLDVWAADPKRTREWTPNNEKVFGFAINAYDRRVDDKAVLTQKRRVYISSISITSQTAQTSGMVQQPFQFAACGGNEARYCDGDVALLREACLLGLLLPPWGNPKKLKSNTTS